MSKSFYTSEDKKVLEKSFRESPYPSAEEKQRLAEVCEKSKKQITVWFSNKRNRLPAKFLTPESPVFRVREPIANSTPTTSNGISRYNLRRRKIDFIPEDSFTDFSESSQESIHISESSQEYFENSESDESCDESAKSSHLAESISSDRNSPQKSITEMPASVLISSGKIIFII